MWLPEALEAALEAYRDAEESIAEGEITFMRAAEMADVSVWEFARLLEERDAARVAADHLAAALDSG